MVLASSFAIGDRIRSHVSVAEANRLALVMAKRSIAIRRDRRRRFPGIAFDDPNWEMMLDLFIAMEEGRRVSVTSLTIAAQVSSSTGLRCIRRLVKDGYMQRIDDPSDARRSFLLLSPAIYVAMREEMLATLDSTPRPGPVVTRDFGRDDPCMGALLGRLSATHDAEQDQES
jgi:hypothetical protein